MPRFFCLLLLLFAVARADARAAFQTPEKMIATSEAIAIVSIEKVEKVRVQGSPWIYSQRATARVERVMKGSLQTEVTLYGDENFICAQCHFVPGRALVFLKRDGNLWTGNNWQFGVRPIKNDQVEWFDKGVFDLKSQPLDAVLKQVQTVVETQAKAPEISLFFLSTKPLWRASNFHAKESRTYESAELKAWIQTLPLGSKISFFSGCRGEHPDSATLEELAVTCYIAGVQWEVELAG